MKDALKFILAGAIMLLMGTLLVLYGISIGLPPYLAILGAGNFPSRLVSGSIIVGVCFVAFGAYLYLKSFRKR